ncbi:hypothetical protein EJ07DRAFT_172145 [Lizonia empirigonia]|nr:hypothetical protein EJ07DRAFT_172145 [Lizonia empirigonia]
MAAFNCFGPLHTPTWTILDTNSTSQTPDQQPVQLLKPFALSQQKKRDLTMSKRESSTIEDEEDQKNPKMLENRNDSVIGSISGRKLRFTGRNSQFLDFQSSKFTPSSPTVSPSPSTANPTCTSATTPNLALPWTKSNAEERPVVRDLTAAFSDTTQANDRPNSPFTKRFQPGSEFYPPWAIEALKMIHTEGFKYDKIFDEGLLKAIKCVAVNLLKHEKLITSVAAPFKLLASSLANNVSNEEKSALIEQGRVAKAEDKDQQAAEIAMLILSGSANLDAFNQAQ